MADKKALIEDRSLSNDLRNLQSMVRRAKAGDEASAQLTPLSKSKTWAFQGHLGRMFFLFFQHLDSIVAGGSRSCLHARGRLQRILFLPAGHIHFGECRPQLRFRRLPALLLLIKRCGKRSR